MQYGVVYSRILTAPEKKSFFLFGPRGTGKSSWVKSRFPDALYLDLLEADLYNDLLARPGRLSEMIPSGFKGWVVLDEVQKIPSLLDEIHRLIENRGCRFALTGSSARKLRRKGVNLLAGRALTYFMFPLTVPELGGDFRLDHSLRWGQLPGAYVEQDAKRYLESYVKTYLQEEVQQEGLTRNLGNFSRFLEAASFSQAGVLDITNVARDCAVERKVVENYFVILEDLLLAFRLPVFAKRAKRRMAFHPKFFFFDAGVFRTLRPMGPLDLPEEAEGAALETLFFQELRALNAYRDLGYSLHYWRTSDGQEVDFVAYGSRGIKAFEIKRASRISRSDLSGLKNFRKDYPMASVALIYGGNRREEIEGIPILPFKDCLTGLSDLLR